MNGLLRRLLFLPEQGSTFAREIDQLHYHVVITTVIAALILGVLAVLFAIRYRRRSERDQPRDVEPRSWFEAVLIAATLAFFLAWVYAGYRQFIRMSMPPRGAIDVYVTGKQWMWEFAYPGGPRTMAVLYVPAGRPVRLLMTSRDVIHSLYIPAFRIKQDVLPGRYTSQWFMAPRPGRFQLLCAEFCGTRHSQMLGEVVVLAPAAFDRWLHTGHLPPGVGATTAESSPELEVRGQLAAEGRRAAERYACLRCHTDNGMPGIGPSWRGIFGARRPLVGGGTALADEAYLTEAIMDPRARLVSGYQPAMPTYQGLIPAPDVAAIVEYIKSLQGRQ